MEHHERLRAALDRLCEAFEPLDLGPLVAPSPWAPEAIDALELTMRQAGFRMPPSYRAGLETGACHIPLARHLRGGVRSRRRGGRVRALRAVAK